MSEIKNSTTDKTVAYVSGDGIFNATTGRKSQIIKDGKIYSSITGELIGTYSGGSSGGGGGSSSEGFGKYRVRFFDYDGTILKTVYTDGGAVTAPNVPEHGRLLFQEWNNDFDNVTSDLDVGAIYTTKSGKCEFDLDINALTGYVVWVGTTLTNGTITIEWGDGSTETLSTAGTTRVSHTYPNTGKYTMMVSGTGVWKFCSNAFFGDSSNNAFNPYAIVAVRLTDLVNNQDVDTFFGMYCCETITIDASSTKSSGSGMFAQAERLEHFNFPRQFPLSGAMFNFAGSLRRVVFNQGTKVIPRDLCTNVGLREDVVLPRDLTEIGYGAFVPNGRFSYMRKVTIPEKVVKIDTCAFYNINTHCTLETLIMKPTTPPSIQFGTGWNAMNSTFPSNGSLKEIIVPAGCAEAYKSATNWSYYADIIKEEE